jgi:hypothetical protein
MRLRHLIVAAMLAGFAPVLMPSMTVDKAEAAQTVTKKKKKFVQKKVVRKNQEVRVKKNFRGPRPGEPDAGWTDDCIFYYNVYGKTPAYCGKYGHGFRMWDW